MPGTPQAAQVSGRPVDALVQRVSSAVEDHLDPHQLLLIGSTARDEHSHGEIAGHRELFSDLELYALVDTPPPRETRRALDEAIDEIEADTGYTNPFFHIEVDVGQRHLFWARTRFDLRIPNAELVREARVLVGTNFDRDPSWLDPDRMDLGSVKEIWLTRLWLQLLHTPKALLGQEPSENRPPYETGLAHLFLARNLLDLPTVILPMQGVLETSYQARRDLLREDHNLAEPLGPDAVEIQDRALEAKRDLAFPRTLEESLRWFVDQFARAGWFLAGRDGKAPGDLPALADELVRELRRRDDPLFAWAAPMRLRRVRRDLALGYQVTRERGLSEAVGYVKGAGVNRVSAVHLALVHALHRLVSGEPADPQLKQAEGVLEELPTPRIDLGDPVRSEHPPADRWLRLRHRLAKFMVVWRGDDPRDVRAKLHWEADPTKEPT